MSVTRTRQTYDGHGNLVATTTYQVSDEVDNLGTIMQRAGQALSANQTFLALASPTNAQVLAQTQRLTRECSALIRVLVGQLSDISDT